MNKKQAVAYAQVTLSFMQSSKYNKAINPENLGMEMRETFKIYKNNIIEEIAKSQNFAEKELRKYKNKEKI